QQVQAAKLTDQLAAQAPAIALEYIAKGTDTTAGREFTGILIVNRSTDKDAGDIIITPIGLDLELKFLRIQTLRRGSNMPLIIEYGKDRYGKDRYGEEITTFDVVLDTLADDFNPTKTSSITLQIDFSDPWRRYTRTVEISGHGITFALGFTPK